MYAVSVMYMYAEAMQFGPAPPRHQHFSAFYYLEEVGHNIMYVNRAAQDCKLKPFPL